MPRPYPTQKWSERRDAFELIVSACGQHPKIVANDSVEDILEDIRNVLSREKVVQIRVSACRACETLSKGLKSAFRGKAGKIVPLLLALF